MIREEIHAILDKCIEEIKDKSFYGQMNFILHCQAGEVKQITDEGWKRTWRDGPESNVSNTQGK